MINNHKQYKVVSDQLDRAIGALESIREEVFPTDKKMFWLMAESYIDTIVELRSEIDSYLKIDVLAAQAGLE